MDIQMPEMDGITVMRKLKEDPATSRIPVIAVTASVLGPDDREFYLGSGFSEYLLKPVYLDKLKEIMGRYLGRPAN